MVWLGILLGCGPSPAAVCAGPHSGTFDGSDTGTIEATLDEKGEVRLTLTSETDTFTSTGDIQDDGTITARGIVTVDGVLDLQTCESTGEWEHFFGLIGSWSMALE